MKTRDAISMIKGLRLLEVGDDGMRCTLRRGEYTRLVIIASWGLGWDHVSVSRSDRCPTWDEMCIVKRAFFRSDECVVQYHPRASDYVNDHPNCLHLWRPQEAEVPMPPGFMV